MRFDNTTITDKEIEREMLFFVPLCTHESPVDCLVVGFDNIPHQVKKISKNIAEIASLGQKGEFASENFDVIMVNNDNANKQELFRILRKDGILCMKLAEDIEKQLTELGSFYRIVMPYHDMKLVFASNKYHPTADIILDRSDFLENAEYYNADIHLASFAIYEKAKKELKGMIKA